MLLRKRATRLLSLKQLCIDTVIAHLDLLHSVGDVPDELLPSILSKCGTLLFCIF